MSDKLIDRAWHQVVADFCDSVGRDLFCANLVQLMSQITEFDNALIVDYSTMDVPRQVYIPEGETPWPPAASLKKYCKGVYLLDPFYQLIVDGAESGLYRLEAIAPDSFHDSEYYRSYYRYAKMADEVNYVALLNRDHAVALSLSRKHRFSSDEMARMNQISPWVVAMMRQHFHGRSRDPDADQKAVHAQVGRAFAHFGASMLTEREQEVTRLILHGHSTNSIAERLGISPETVKVHRKNIYSKLDIGSQAELFYLFIDSITAENNQFYLDPLENYYKKP